MTDRSVSIALIAKVSGFVAGIKTAEASVAKLNAQIAASAKKQQSLRELGNAAGAMGAVAAIGVGLVVRAAANFEQAMSRVAATGDDAKNNLNALHDAAIQAGQATKFSATEAADGITELLKAGVSARDVLSGGLLGALNLASAGELDVADAANIMATAMSQFNLPGTQAGHVADLLAAAAGKAQGEVSDMAQALKYVGPVAASMGVSIEQTTGTIAELANKGILADQAGTSLRGMLTALTSPSKIAADEMKKLGINVYDASGQFVGFQGVAGQLQTHMKNLSNAERDEALGRIFGNQQITAARILYAGGAADVAKWTKAVNDNGFAADTAATKMDNLAGDLEQLRGSLETALITTGEGSQGPLRDVVQLLTDLVNAYNQLPGPVKSGAVALLALVAAIGLSAFAASRAVLAYQNFGKNLALLGIQTGNLSKSMLAGRAALLGVAAAAFVLSSNISDTHKTMSGLLNVAGAMAAGFAFGPVAGGLATFAALVQAAGAESAKAAAYQSQLASAAQSVAQSLDQQTGALTRNSQAVAVKFLADNQAFDAAEKIGVSYADVTKAALGNEAAYKRVTAAANDYATANGTVGVAVAGTLVSAVDASKDSIDQQRNALDDSNAANAEMGTQSGQTAGSVNTLTKGVQDAAAATKQWTNELQHLSDILSNRSSVRDYEAALDAARKASKSNADITQENTDKQRKAQAAFDAVAQAALAHKDAMDKAGKSTGEQQKFLEGARDDLIDLAKKFNTGKQSAQEFTDTVLKIPTIHKTTAEINFERARAQALAYKAYIENLPVTMTIRQQIVETRLGVPRARGGEMHGPGTATSDSILARLSDGEFVVNARSTAKHLPLLHAINAQGFAAGGQAGAAQDLQRLLDRFHVGPKDTASDVRSMVAAVVAALKQVVGADSPLVDHLKDVGDRLVDTAKSYDNATAKLDQLQAQFKDIATSVASAFQHDLFGGSLQDAELQARADRNDAREARRDLAQARRRGLNANLAQQVAASGNTALLDQLAHATPKEIREFERLFQQRQQATRGLGRDVAQAVTGHDIRHQTRVLDNLDHRLGHLERVLRHLPDGVEKGARDGTHSGSAASSRSAAARRRVA